jgi:hypothetical protein
MKIKRIHFLLIFSLFFSQCEKTELRKDFDCKIGNVYRINNDLSFVIDSINDSRCPENATCFWAGDVYLYFNIINYKSIIDTTMSLRGTYRNQIKIGDHVFKILDVTPLIGGGASTSKDFTVKLVITKS